MCKPRPKYPKTVRVNASQRGKCIAELMPWFLGFERRGSKYMLDIANPFGDTYCLPYLASIILSQSKGALYDLISRIDLSSV